MKKPITRRQLLLMGGASVVIAGLGCAHTRGSAAAKDPTLSAMEAMVDVSTIPIDFVARQRITGSMGEQTLSSEVVLQKQGDTLTLIGLTPFGTKAFALIQRGLDMEFTPFVDVGLPFPPELMLADVHRTLFVGIGDVAIEDVRRRLRVGQERIDEIWIDGRLVRRSFTRRRGQPKGLININYGEGMIERTPPPLIKIDNQRFGYRVDIETVSYQRLA